MSWQDKLVEGNLVVVRTVMNHYLRLSFACGGWCRSSPLTAQRQYLLHTFLLPSGGWTTRNLAIQDIWNPS